MDLYEEDPMDVVEEEDDPVICEFDVYLNNTVLQDLLGNLAESANSVAVANELCSKVFGDLFLLQYPLEHATSDSGANEEEVEKHNRIATCSNATDMLFLSTLSIGTESKREVIDERMYGVSSVIKKSKRKECPYLKFVYDIGTKFPPSMKPLTVKKSSRGSSPFMRHESPDLTSTLHLFDLPAASHQEKRKTLKLRSEIVSGDHVCDCLGVLVVEPTEEGLKRSLHIVPVRGVIQLRPKVKPYMSEIVNFDDSLNSLFQNRNLQWRDVSTIRESDSVESMEIVQMLKQSCLSLEKKKESEIYFHTDPSLYINAVCFAQDYGETQEYHRNLESDVDGYHHSINPLSRQEAGNILYREMQDHTPNIQFMSQLDVRTQLKLLLTRRAIDSFYALKRDIVCKDATDEHLIEILQEFGTVIDGNWILSSEHAIPNYTTEDESDEDDRSYLMICRDVILGLFYRDVIMRDLLQKGAYGHVTIEAIHSLTGLPYSMVHEMLSQVAKQHGKLWTLKLKRDNEFCKKYPALMDTYKTSWGNRLQECMRHVRNIRESRTSQVSMTIYRYMLKTAIINTLRNRVYSTEQISEELTTSGLSIDSATVFENLLQQVALPFYRGNTKYWVLKKSNLALKSLKMAILGHTEQGAKRLTADEVQSVQNNPQLPGFVKRRITVLAHKKDRGMDRF